VLSDFPAEMEYGIDVRSWVVGPKFRGSKMITPGLHLVHYSGGHGSTLGFWLRATPGGVVVRRSDPDCAHALRFHELTFSVCRWDPTIEALAEGCGSAAHPFPISPSLLLPPPTHFQSHAEASRESRMDADAAERLSLAARGLALDRELAPYAPEEASGPGQDRFGMLWADRRRCPPSAPSPACGRCDCSLAWFLFCLCLPQPMPIPTPRSRRPRGRS